MAKVKKSKTRRRGLSGAPAEHTDRMRRALRAGEEHLKAFREALDKRGDCRSVGRNRGADEELFDVIASAARASREAEHAGMRQDAAVAKFADDADDAAIEFSRRCVRVASDLD